MIDGKKIKAHFVLVLFILVNLINAQSLDDINAITTILPDISDSVDINNQQVNKTTTLSINLPSNSSTDVNVSSSTHSNLVGLCQNDTHCELPNQFCKFDNNQTKFGKCECTKGFVGDFCDHITDCSMCANRSKCKNVNNTLICACKNGYFGTTCEKNHCGICVHGVCVLDEFTDQYDCFCANGYSGPGCTEDFNDCLGNTKCLNNGTCIDRVAGFVCNCPNGFKGKFCEQDIDECSNNPCLNGAECKNTFGAYTCNCVVGFRGVNCEENIDDCANSPCKNGKCIDKVNSYECNCEDSGFTGTNCEKNINDCEHNPCQNGAVCEDLIKDFQCHCPKGFKGKLCEEVILECDSKPCKNGGICIEKRNGSDETFSNGTTSDDQHYYCKCDSSWTGVNCEINVDDCLNVDCNNGTCIDLVGSYKCNCKRGYSGKHCEQDINMCELNNPCKNHGKCIDGSGSEYHCDCSDTGFTGVDCSININECEDENPCEHNGTCIDHSPYYECLCLTGYKGIHCEEDINECASSPCHNNGVCFQKSDPKLYGFHNKNLPFYGQEFNYLNASGYICRCPAGITGLNCDFNENECQNVNCHNGTCKDGINEYQCLCYPGFEGDHCELETNKCLNNPCLNGGECKKSSKIGDFECECPMYKSGKRCEHVFTGCDTNLCLNNGTCLQNPKQKDTFICSCLENYEGEYCQMKISKDFDLLFLVIISSCCLAIVVFLICTLMFIRRIKKARATRGTYSPSTQEMFGNSAGEILKPPPEERLI